MSERYTKLFSLEENLYAEGSPVIIQAGALQKDNQNGKVLAQLRFKNISDKIIECIAVSITPFDTAGRLLADMVEYKYLDLKAERDVEFGSKQPIYLNDITTRAFKVLITEIVFSDKSIWKNIGTEWSSLDLMRPVTIREYLNSDHELIEQYELNTGGDLYCVAEREKDLWICGCGSINHDYEESCHNCSRTFEELMQALDIDTIKIQANEHLELKRQEEEAEKLAKEKLIAERKALFKKHKKKIIAGISVILTLLIAFIVSKNTLIPFLELKLCREGSTIHFGKYEQDNIPINGTEQIKWIVVKKEGDKALVVSKYCIESGVYHNKNEIPSWNKSSLRHWLNNSFINIAFSNNEKNRVLSTTFADSDFETEKIFLLNESEMKDIKAVKKIKLTKKALKDYSASGPWGDPSNPSCWLRTPSGNTINSYGSTGSLNIKGIKLISLLTDY